MSKVGAVIVAAGSSTRMGGVDKTFAPVLGLPLVVHTINQFESSPIVNQIVLVVANNSVEQAQELIQQRAYSKVTGICVGGLRRQDSVRSGLESLNGCEWVMVHDGARPCLDEAILQRGLEAALEYGSAIAGVPIKDTIKIVSPQQIVEETPDRSLLWAAQTPQVFQYQMLLDTHHAFDQDVTDDAAMIESLGHPVKMYLGSYRNIKVTTSEDLVIAEAFLKSGAKNKSNSDHPIYDSL